MSQAAPEALKNVVEVPREVSGAATQDDQLVESSLRPRSLEEYVGQPKITTNLKIFLRAAKARREALDHVLFFDEIHRLKPQIEEVLYPAMEDYQLDIMIGQGTAARSIKLDLPKFTLVGATTRAGLITAPLRGRFGIVFHLDFYSQKDLEIIVHRSAEILGAEIEATGASEIARRSRGTPRIANRLLRRVRDFAEVEYDGRVTREVARRALDEMEVDKFGLDEIDRKVLTTIIEKFDGGPVGVGTISASISEERESIEAIIEPYLIQIGFLNRTPRGRVCTPAAYKHMGFTPPRQGKLLAG